jgi:hypothetical protein
LRALFIWAGLALFAGALAWTPAPDWAAGALAGAYSSPQRHTPWLSTHVYKRRWGQVERHLCDEEPRRCPEELRRFTGAIGRWWIAVIAVLGLTGSFLLGVAWRLVF